MSPDGEKKVQDLLNRFTILGLWDNSNFVQSRILLYLSSYLKEIKTWAKEN